MAERRRPLSVREGGAQSIASFDAPVEGVPVWLRQALLDWMGWFTHSGGEAQEFAMKHLEVSLRLTGIDWIYGARTAYSSFIKICTANEEAHLNALDLIVADHADSYSWRERVDGLAGILERGGSVWTVAPDRSGLTRRVLPSAEVAARELVESGIPAGELLAGAWKHAFGRNPIPGMAYREAVRAVEAATIPVVMPNDRTATLGKVIGQVRARPDLFVCVFPGVEDGTSPINHVRALIELLWTNQSDRHGGKPGDPAPNVSQAEAAAAVHAAVTLVQWFHSGALRRA